MAGETIYVDTSGLLAMLDADDACHAIAGPVWREMIGARAALAMTDYVRLESWSLIQRRLGMAALRDFRGQVLPLCSIESVGEEGFFLLAQQALLASRGDVSLVDLSSFACMHRCGLRHAFAFDAHYDQQGFITPEHRQWPFTPRPSRS